MYMVISISGKSTVAALTERFYDIDQGEILIDDHPIKSLDPSWLRGSVIGFINQEPVLFATSVPENIRYTVVLQLQTKRYTVCGFIVCI